MDAEEPRKIENLKDLAEELGSDETEASMSRRVYKGTSCGAWLAHTSNGVRVGSIVEGTDQCANPVELSFPFTDKEFWAALDDIEKQCDAIWKDTHGCEKCWPNGTVDQYGNTFEPGEIGAPVNPDCPGCGGDGIIL